MSQNKDNNRRDINLTRYNKDTATKWHRIIALMVLCLFGLSIAYSVKPKRTKARQKVVDNRVYLQHADELFYDQYSIRPSAQIARGHVQFMHKGARLTCDSAYFYEMSNSFEAFGHVDMKQGDTVRMVSDYAWYDGNEEMAEARRNVVLTHRKTKLYCDSLNYDRMYGIAYFFEGGKLVDNDNTLVSDWGQYNTENKQAVFYYKVNLKNKKFNLDTDTLYYDTRTKLAHAVGPSIMVSDSNTVHTNDGYYNTNTERSELYGRSTVYNGKKTITADSLYTNSKTNENEGFGNVIYIDPENKNMFTGNHIFYNQDTGYGYATDSAVVMDYSQGPDTLYMHGDSIKMFTFNINTDSVYRKIHAYNHVRAYRQDIQAVCDSLTFSSLDSCMTMYKDPIVWNLNRQILGEVIHAYMNDSTIRFADVIGQALSVEQMDDSTRFNQISSTKMEAYFDEGKLRQTKAIGNVQVVFYPIDDGDSTIIGLNYLETDTLKMFLSPERKLERMWTSKAQGTMYPMTQIPPDKLKLSNFAWFAHIRPKDKDDIFEWRGKGASAELKEVKRREAPKRKLAETDASKVKSADIPPTDAAGEPEPEE